MLLPFLCLYPPGPKYGDILTMKKEIQKKAAEDAAAVEAAEEAKNRRIRTASELKRANSSSGRQTPTYLPRIHPKAPYEAPLPIIRPGTSPQSLPGSKVPLACLMQLMMSQHRTAMSIHRGLSTASAAPAGKKSSTLWIVSCLR